MEGLLNRALTEKQKLEMIYIDSEGNMSQRVVRIVDVRNDSILAYCYFRKEVRSFKRDNILSVGLFKDRKDLVN